MAASEIQNKNKYEIIGADTIGFSIPQEEFKITNLETFRPIGPHKLISTVTQKQKRREEYVPKIQLTRVGRGFDLYMELSVSKLIYGNNVDELTTLQAEDFIDRLQKHLESRGILIDKEALRRARLCRVDFYKDMLCKSAPFLIAIIKHQLCLNQKILRDINYKNGGTAVRIQTANTDVIIYDKIREILLSSTSDKLCAEQECYCQRNLIQALAKEGAEILRIEQRLSRRRTVKRVFSRFGITNPQLIDIFNYHIAYTLINKTWDEIMQGMLPLVETAQTLKSTFANALKTNLYLKDIFAYLGWYGLLKECPANEIKQLLRGTKQKRALKGFTKRIKGFDIEPMENIQKKFSYLTEQIKEWMPVWDGLPFIHWRAIYENKPNLKDYNIYMQEETPNEEKSGHTC